MLNLPFYQSEWFNISLDKIARVINHPRQKVAGSVFYHHFYQELLKDPSHIPESWLKLKEATSLWMEKRILELKDKNANVLSLGAGLGVVEVKLIEKGFKIDLQECQPISIEYLHNNINQKENINVYVSEDLSDIPSNSYDIIFAITSTYCLPYEILSTFLKEARRCLREDGFLVLYETALSYNDIYRYLLSLRHPPQGVLWGWKRSVMRQKKLARQIGFAPLTSHFFDAQMREIFPTKMLGIPLSATWQELIFKK